MKNEEFNTKLSSRFDSLHDTLIEVLSQLFKQEFVIQQSGTGSNTPKSDIQADNFPRVLVQFNTSTPSAIFQIWSLPMDLVLNLYAWMIDLEADEAVTDEHLEGLKEGIEQIFGQIRGVLDGEGISLEVSDLQLLQVETIDTVDLASSDDTGATLSYTVEVAGNSYAVNQYLFADVAALGAEKDDAAMSDDDIAMLLEDADVGARVNIDDDFGDDVDVRTVEFGEFDESSGIDGNGQPRNISMLLDVDLEVLVELGRKTMLIKEVLKLGKGSVLELDKAAGEPLGIFVNGRKLAEGEVVVVDDHFGIRITQLAGQAERIKSLG